MFLLAHLILSKSEIDFSFDDHEAGKVLLCRLLHIVAVRNVQ